VLAAAETVIIPGWPVGSVVPVALIDAVLAAQAGGARLVSICSDAFVLAAAGVLDGRSATTHWQYAGELAARHPGVTVLESALYVDDCTGAGAPRARGPPTRSPAGWCWHRTGRVGRRNMSKGRCRSSTTMR